MRFQLAFNSGRSISDEGWESVYPADVAAWQEADQYCRERELTCPDGTARVAADWGEVQRRVKLHLDVTRELYAVAGTSKASEVAERYDSSATSASIAVTLAQGPIHPKMGAYVVESFLHDVFLEMNLSSPGCCDFSRLQMISIDGDEKSEISLSNLSFEAALLDGREGKWPCPRLLSLSQVSSWYSITRRSTTQLPSSPVEKALFALLHIAGSSYSPTTLVWIFYALEAVFQTKTGENFRILRDRIELLLRPNRNEVAYLQKQLRKLYDIRSAFVHGNLEILHPMQNEILDKRIDDEHSKIMYACDFGTRILICAVQELIERRWSDVIFFEVMKGEPADVGNAV